MSSPSQPTLIYPNGNEIISAKYIIIEWKESIPVSDGSVSWYEIYYTDNYDYLEEPDWKMIAIVPSGITIPPPLFCRSNLAVEPERAEDA